MTSKNTNSYNTLVDSNKRAILRKTWHNKNSKGGEPLKSKTYENASFFGFVNGLNQIQKDTK